MAVRHRHLQSEIERARRCCSSVSRTRRSQRASERTRAGEAPRASPVRRDRAGLRSVVEPDLAIAGARGRSRGRHCHWSGMETWRRLSPALAGPRAEPGLLESLAHGRSSQRAGARRRSGARKPCDHAGPELRRRADPAIARLDAAARKHVLVGHEHLATGAASHQDLGPTPALAQENQRSSVFRPGAAAAHAIRTPSGGAVLHARQSLT